MSRHIFSTPTATGRSLELKAVRMMVECAAAHSCPPDAYVLATLRLPWPLRRWARRHPVDVESLSTYGQLFGSPHPRSRRLR